MMGFRDMTFCCALCDNEDCHRKLTDKVRDDAVKWWGDDGAPIAICDFSNNCDEYIEGKEIPKDE